MPNAVERVKRMHDTRRTLESTLRNAQEVQRLQYDKKHQPHQFRKGDHVMLSTKNLALKQPSKKMIDKFIGPFVVQDAVGAQAYRLRLPPSYRMHNVFHVSLLKPYHHRTGEPEVNVSAPEVAENGGEQWIVQKILDKRTRRGKTEYLA